MNFYHFPDSILHSLSILISSYNYVRSDRLQICCGQSATVENHGESFSHPLHRRGGAWNIDPGCRRPSCPYFDSKIWIIGIQKPQSKFSLTRAALDTIFVYVICIYFRTGYTIYFQRQVQRQGRHSEPVDRLLDVSNRHFSGLLEIHCLQNFDND